MTDPITPFVVRDFPDMGKYKVRLMSKRREGRSSTWLDVREYASGPNYQGFTRRGIRITTLDELRNLLRTLETIQTEELFE